jgi:hypothetical protein
LGADALRSEDEMTLTQMMADATSKRGAAHLLAMIEHDAVAKGAKVHP